MHFPKKNAYFSRDVLTLTVVYGFFRARHQQRNLCTRMTTNQEARGSNPFGCTIYFSLKTNGYSVFMF